MFSTMEDYDVPAEGTWQWLDYVRGDPDTVLQCDQRYVVSSFKWLICQVTVCDQNALSYRSYVIYRVV